MEFTREKTSIVKGLAICLMFTHHLYAFKDRLLNANGYIPLIPFFDAEKHLGAFGNICVSMFLFLSGYGMFLGYLRSSKNILNYSFAKLKDFYLNYWLYFLVFIPIGIIFFKHVTFWQSTEIRYSTEPLVFLGNFLGLSSTYNGEWWFVRVFLITITVLFPFYAKLAQRNIVLLCLLSLFLFLISIKFNLDRYDGMFNFMFWQTSFAIGIVCAQLKFFSSNPIQYLDRYGWMLVFPALMICFIIRIKFGGTSSDFLIVPFFIYFSLRAIEILHLPKLSSYLGEYAFSLWLVHSFFCYYYFQNVVYFPKWSPLIFILLTTMSLLSVLGIEYLRSFLKLGQFANKCAGQIKKLWSYFTFTSRE
jgi:hypothetical protein